MTTLTAPAPDTGLTPSQKTISLVAILLAVLLASMNQTIVTTAGPAIQTALHIENSLYSWITTAYLLASTTLVPIYGKLSDLYGRRVILLFGTVVFIVGSVLCGTAAGVGMLIAGRAVQGLGGAALIGLMYAVIADLYAPEERSRYIGLIGAVFSLSTVLGSVIGGYVTDTFGWHNVFFISVPLGIAAVVTMLFMPALKQERERAPLDVPGAGLLSLFSVTLLLALSLGKTSVAPGESGFLWGSWQILALFAAAVVSLIAFVQVERRAADPIIDVRLFSNRTFAVANIVTFLLGVVFFAATVFLPLYMVNVVGLSATRAGLTTFPLTLGLVVSSIVAGQVFSKSGRMKPIIYAGGVMLMLSFVLMGYTLRVDSTQVELTWKMIVVGLGLGPILPMLTIAIQGAVSPRDIGAATGTNNFLRSLGSTIGVAVLGTLFASTLKTDIQGTVAAASQQLPAALRTQFSASGSSGGSAQNFDAQHVRAQVEHTLDQTRARYVAALRDHDPAAVQALVNDPSTDAQLRSVLQQGGIEATIRAGFDQQRAVLERALIAHDPAAIQTVTATPQLPQAVRELARDGASGLVPASVSRGALKQVLAGLDAREAQTLATQPQATLQRVLTGLDDTRATVLPVIDQIGAGVKHAFTDAVSLLYRVGLGVTVLALLVSVLLPETRPGAVTPQQVAEDELRSIEV
ncbi:MULTISPECIES: MDR family MFS transporter [Deinococcus]|uniref:MDR family MFS transporter n=1 Tax=Deinococcus rufus TaxID=2136097 RepID=A0ABV7Z4D5_9DEIO|nr:DHA2 family efflux MFS transporter permease subunit [Deinococcus sp. AB2017081]WQE95479.1 DHA2 family efflux MFS transporter permease subunit [Deinococcus sp. AB2017081]